ncbi:MAG: FkbM family methyltransferase [Aquabacterium sp.]|nr:MAG: FkbM family methyltransferase [Aquabacterium sp.]
MTGNGLAQRLLQRNVFVSQYLMGIGSGSSASSSGELAVFKLLRGSVPGPYCVFDIGANKGQFLGVALQGLAGSAFTVHCFEPGRETFGLLSRRPADERVVLNNIGLGREAGSMTLYYDAPGSGLASLTRRRLDHLGIDFGQSEPVRIDTVDAYCEARGISRIHLLKADIEGHELDAFAGASRLFAAGAVDMVTFEFGGCNLDTRTSFRDFWHFFAEAGMRLLRITPSGYLAPLASYQELDEQYRTTNFVAIRA